MVELFCKHKDSASLYGYSGGKDEQRLGEMDLMEWMQDVLMILSGDGGLTAGSF